VVRIFILGVLLALAGCQIQERTVPGTVVSVLDLPAREQPEDSGKHYEDPLVPEVAWKIQVRLDDGTEVTTTHAGSRRYEPGERVRLLLNEDGALLL
jgi:hypothetical protein